MTPQTARYRADTIGKIREFFRVRGVLEVETPVIGHAASIDAHIDLFTADSHNGGRSPAPDGTTGWLQPSPEFHMKRLLSQGYPDIFQICKAFRNGEYGRLHNPEFTILEWYRRGFSMERLIDEVVDISKIALTGAGVEKSTYQDAFRAVTGLDPLTVPVADLALFCAHHEIADPPFRARADGLNFVMARFVEPLLPRDRLCVIHRWPSELAVLAVLDPEDPRVARRFEVYYNGVELCNGWEELADAGENRRRQDEENQRRYDLGKPAIPVDMRFIDALRHDFPPCSGAALGLDRLIMLGAGLARIGDVIAFPWDEA